jgi:putative DNA primase/helicase
MISPTCAIYGDWSSGLSGTWRDENHRDDAEFRRQLAAARAKERAFATAARQRRREAAHDARALIREATLAPHPYLARKGFPERTGLVHGEKLLIPIRAAEEYERILSVQEIDVRGEKRFLKGSRTRGGIHRLGVPNARRTALCEGYATALSLEAALKRLPGPHAVVACFSASNLELVAPRFPEALVCADHDASRTGETAAARTGLKWVMPPEVATDFNDMHLAHGLLAVTEVLRSAL